MCMFCAAIPAVAATGAALNNKQVQRRSQASNADGARAAEKPVIRITAGIIALLVLGSVTYHTLVFRS